MEATSRRDWGNTEGEGRSESALWGGVNPHLWDQSSCGLLYPLPANCHLRPLGLWAGEILPGDGGRQRYGLKVVPGLYQCMGYKPWK